MYIVFANVSLIRVLGLFFLGEGNNQIHGIQSLIPANCDTIFRMLEFTFLYL